MKIEDLKRDYPNLGTLAESLVDKKDRDYPEYLNTNLLVDAFCWVITEQGEDFWSEVNNGIKLDEKEANLSLRNYPKEMWVWNRDYKDRVKKIVFSFTPSLIAPYLAYIDENKNTMCQYLNAEDVNKIKTISREEVIKRMAESFGVEESQIQLKF